MADTTPTREQFHGTTPPPITVVGATSNALTTNATSMAISKPTGTAAGDRLASSQRR
jgi:hypothetical protein